MLTTAWFKFLSVMSSWPLAAVSRLRKKYSSGSMWVSPITSTLIVLTVSPGANFTISNLDTKSGGSPAHVGQAVHVRKTDVEGDGRVAGLAFGHRLLGWNWLPTHERQRVVVED